MPPFKALVKNRVVEWQNAQINTLAYSVHLYNKIDAYITFISFF